MKVLLVDDEKLARERLRRMLADVPQLEIVGEAANGLQAIEAIGLTQPDVVLLDIRMPGMDGLEVARHLTTLDQAPAVIFCTAYEDHALEAFAVQAVGYVLKPVRKADLERVLAGARRVNRVQLAALHGDAPLRRTHIAARTRRGLEVVPIEDVRYFMADQKYVTVRHVGGELLVDETLRELELEFAERFVRVHRNSVIAGGCIEALERDNDGRHYVRLRDVPMRLDVSRRHVAELRKYIEEL